MSSSSLEARRDDRGDTDSISSPRQYLLSVPREEVDAGLPRTTWGLENQKDEKETIRQKLVRVRSVWWWTLGAIILAVPLARSVTLWAEILWFGLWLSHFVAWCIGRVSYFLCQEDYLGITDYRHFVDNLMIPMTLTIWAVVSWATVPVLCYFDRGDCEGGWIPGLRRALLATLVVAVIFLVKSLVIEMIFTRSIAGFLSARRDCLLSHYYALVILWYDPTESTEESPSRGWLKSLENMVMHRKPDKKDIKNLIDGGGGEDTYVDIYEHIKKSFGRGSIKAKSLEERLEDCKKAEKKYYKECSQKFTSEELLRLLGLEKDDKDNFEEVKILVREVGEGLKEVTTGVEDIRKVVGNLDSVMSLVVLLGIVLVYAAFFTEHLDTYLTPVWATFTGLGFALSGTVQEFLAACNFVFVKHPYDVGDHVVLKERQLIVQDIYLTYTTFRGVENGVVIHIPHSEIRKEWIENWSRTKELKEKYPLATHCPHSIDIGKINKGLERFVADEDELQTSRYLKPVVYLEPDLHGVTGEIKVRREICHEERSFRVCNDEHAQRRNKILNEAHNLLRPCLPVLAGGGDKPPTPPPTTPRNPSTSSTSPLLISGL